MAKRVKTSVSVDPKLWKKVRMEAIERDKDLGDALEEALTGWLRGSQCPAESKSDSPTDSRPIPVYRSNTHMHKLLDRILHSGSEDTVKAIRFNLLTFAAGAQFLAGHPELFLQLEEEAEESEKRGKA